MEAVVLAGGFGTRLRPLTYTRPKPLLPVAGRPMLEHALDRLPGEVDHVVVAVNWLAEAVEEHVASWSRDVACTVVREAEPLGTAGAVRNCAGHLGERFFVLNADIVSDMDLGSMVAQHQDTGAAATIALKEVAPEEVSNYGVVALDQEDPRRVMDFVEKPPSAAEAPSRLINAGAYLLERRVLDLVPGGRLVSMEKEVFPQILGTGLYGWRHEGWWVDVGDPVRILEASRRVDPSYRWGPGAVVARDAVFRGSVAGRGLRVGAGARVEESVLGDGVEVAPGAVLRRSVVGDGERVSGEHVGARLWGRGVPEGYPEKQVGNVLPGQ